MDALSNLSAIRADVIEVWDSRTLTYRPIQDTIQQSIVGLAPAQLNSIELVAAAIGNDAGFFSTIAEGLDVKAEIAYVDAQLALRDTAIASRLAPQSSCRNWLHETRPSALRVTRVTSTASSMLSMGTLRERLASQSWRRSWLHETASLRGKLAVYSSRLNWRHETQL